MAAWEPELKSLLEKERSLLESLEKSSSEKTDVLVKGDIDKLSEMINEEQPLVMQLEAYEKRRDELLKKNNLSGKTLAEICEVAESEYKDIFKTELKALREITEKIKKRNEINDGLTKSRLEFYGKIRSLMAKPGYDNDGTLSQKSDGAASLIDRKI